MIGKCSNCDNYGSPFGKIHEEFEDRPTDELLCVFCGDEAIEKENMGITMREIWVFLRQKTIKRELK